MVQKLLLNWDDPSVQRSSPPKFPSGEVVATPAALAAMEAHQCTPFALLARHLAGDWGSVPVEDAQLNDQALQSGGRLLSSYTIAPGTRIWLITEWYRSVSTFLLPSEY